MSKLKITQVKSAVHRDKSQKATLLALGIKKMQQTVEHNDTPQIQGMVRKIAHLLSVEKA